MSLEHGKVRQLEGRHADGALDGHAHLDAALGHLNIIAMYQGEAVVFSYVDQAHIGRIAYGKARGVFHVDGYHRVASVVGGT